MQIHRFQATDRTHMVDPARELIAARLAIVKCEASLARLHRLAAESRARAGGRGGAR